MLMTGPCDMYPHSARKSFLSSIVSSTSIRRYKNYKEHTTRCPLPHFCTPSSGPSEQCWWPYSCLRQKAGSRCSIDTFDLGSQSMLLRSPSSFSLGYRMSESLLRSTSQPFQLAPHLDLRTRTGLNSLFNFGNCLLDGFSQQSFRA